MNVPFRNITTANTAKGVPVWVTDAQAVRRYAECKFSEMHNKKKYDEKTATDAERNEVVEYKKQLSELLELMKQKFNRDQPLGNASILLSIQCINALELDIKHEICAEFLEWIAFHRFGGVGYTGPNTQKVITVSRDTQIPCMLPFVLREDDRIVSGCGVYVASVNFDKAVGELLSGAPTKEKKDVCTLLFDCALDELESKFSGAKTEKNFCLKILPEKGNTLYGDVEPCTTLHHSTRREHVRTYFLCTVPRDQAFRWAVHGHKYGITLSPHPLLTIETQNNTLATFKQIAQTLTYSVRASNAEGLAVTACVNGIHRHVDKKRMHKRSAAEAGLECELQVVHPQEKTTQAVPTSAATGGEMKDMIKILFLSILNRADTDLRNEKEFDQNDVAVQKMIQDVGDIKSSMDTQTISQWYEFVFALLKFYDVFNKNAPTSSLMVEIREQIREMDSNQNRDMETVGKMLKETSNILSRRLAVPTGVKPVEAPLKRQKKV